jgi:hypothetical protein
MPISLDGAPHSLAIECDIAVGAVTRPRIDHVGDPIAGDCIVGTERDCVAPVVVDVRAAAERGAGDERRRHCPTERFSS